LCSVRGRGYRVGNRGSEQPLTRLSLGLAFFALVDAPRALAARMAFAPFIGMPSLAAMDAAAFWKPGCLLAMLLSYCLTRLAWAEMTRLLLGLLFIGSPSL